MAAFFYYIVRDLEQITRQVYQRMWMNMCGDIVRPEFSATRLILKELKSILVKICM